MVDAEYSPDKFSGSQIPGQENPLNLKFLLFLLIPLLIAGIGLGYYLYNRGDLELPFLPKPSPVPQAAEQAVVPSLALTDTSRIENCDATRVTDPLVDKVTDITPDAREIDFRGWVQKAGLETSTQTVKLELMSYDARQFYTFDVPAEHNVNRGDEAIFKVGELKAGDGVYIASNCKPGVKGSLKISRIYKEGT